MYKTEKERVVVFGLRTKFGGGSTQGFGMVYDDEESQKKFEPRYRLVRVSLSVPSSCTPMLFPVCAFRRMLTIVL